MPAHTLSELCPTYRFVRMTEQRSSLQIDIVGATFHKRDRPLPDQHRVPPTHLDCSHEQLRSPALDEWLHFQVAREQYTMHRKSSLRT